MTMLSEGADGMPRLRDVPSLENSLGNVANHDRDSSGEAGWVRTPVRDGAPQDRSEARDRYVSKGELADPVEAVVDEFGGALLSMDEAIRKCDRIDEAAGRLVRARREMMKLCRKGAR